MSCTDDFFAFESRFTPSPYFIKREWCDAAIELQHRYQFRIRFWLGKMVGVI